MNSPTRFRQTLALCMAGWMSLQPLVVTAEDIDIFVGSSAGSSDRPNVLIVLDNTSNWARQSQQWPGGLQQGQAETRAIKTVLSSIGNDINVGVLEFVTDGNANDNGGFTRYAIKEMTDANKTTLAGQMDQIFSGINSSNEKRNANTPYGNLFYDVYNYFSGGNVSLNGNNLSRNLNPPNIYVDAAGYDATYSNFKTPLHKDNSCAKNYVIFISNPNSSGPSADSTENKAALASLGGDTSTIALPNFTMSETNSSAVFNTTGGCYNDAATCTTEINNRVTTEVKFRDVCVDYDGDNDSTYTQCACTSTYTPPAVCAPGTERYTVYGHDPAGTTNLGYMSSCVSNTNQCDTSDYAAQCTGTGVSCSCNASDYIETGCGQNKKRFMIQRIKSNTTATPLGFTSGCYANVGACSTSDYAADCNTYPGGCSCNLPVATSGSCGSGSSRYWVSGNTKELVATPTGTYDSVKGAQWMIDEWARFMYQKGMPVEGGDSQTAATYTIDVYNKQQNNDHTALMLSTARVGGGKYFAATNEEALVNALKKIFQEITSVNSTFASASLPVNATNRAQNENQVFIGMFRPDPEAKPRWFGNLKRYQLIIGSDGVSVLLGDKDGNNAINDQTGFVDDCATSWWTTDSPHDPTDLSKGYYWSSYAVNPHPASKCTSVTGAKVYSDAPDGPTVEKGAIAEVVRKGNNPSATDLNPTWSVNRNFYTTNDYVSTIPLAGIGSATALSTAQGNWLVGQDTENEDVDTHLTETRASLHGDVVHSRPLPVNYGNKVVVFYGANDGNFRAVDADTGKELWTFIPHEFAQPELVDRLRTNEPLVSYPDVDMSIQPTPRSKDYAWDGSIGLLASYNEDTSALTKAWIYPTMRRGGRRVYALDVTSDAPPPIIKWIVGCNKDGTNCSGGFEDIGQTWSTPNAAPVAGYPAEQVVFFGGGYDACEDADTPTPACGSAKGRKIYAVDAASGTLLKALDTARSVPSDISLLDIDGDGKADYGYAADTGGNLYRIDMVSRNVSADGSVSYTALAPAAWTIRKIAATSGGGRKFLFAPAIFPIASAGRVYIALGSGDREHPLQTHYPFTQVVNRFYVYLDNLAITSGSAADLDALVNTTADLGCESQQITPTSEAKGWFMDLNQYGQGEQTVTSAIIAGGLVAFSTNRPIPKEAGSCASPLGEARGYWVNLLSGAGTIGVAGTCGGDRSSTFVGGGLPPSPVIGTVPIGGKPRTVVIGAVQKEGGASTPISPQKVKPSIAPIRKRVYWKLQGVD
jgi:type IV pilus assembly protein PilY1